MEMHLQVLSHISRAPRNAGTLFGLKVYIAVTIEYLYYKVDYANGDDVDIPLDIGVS